VRAVLGLSVVLATAVVGFSESRVGAVEFFGYGDLDVEALRAELPVRGGDVWTREKRVLVERSAEELSGEAVTHVATICCDENGDRLIFIGLARAVRPPHVYDAPTGRLRLSRELLRLHADGDRAIQEAAERGGEAVQQDNSLGYALTRDPAVRSVELKVRAYALANADEIFGVLADSSNARHRAVAADAAGYAEHSREQVEALLHAVRDPDGEVRNNAIRAIGVLVGSDLELAVPIDAAPFWALLESGRWHDRNKALGVLFALTRSREGLVAGEVPASALAALVECARWRSITHSYFARMVLGRLAGFEEGDLNGLVRAPGFMDRAVARLAEDR